jgi:L-lactate utilization protein LutC
MEDLAAAIANGPEFRGLTLITGPSMTGDIEMMPVFGVHGPGKLFVIVWSE